MKHMWSEEEIQSFKKDISNLVDSKGNPRFIEGEGTPATIEGFTPTYYKWSLSGTHLMLVLAATLANTTALTSATVLINYTLPKYIISKIVPAFEGGPIDMKTINAYASDWSNQSIQCKLWKNNNTLYIQTNSITLTANRNLRVQFDILIDSE